MVSIGTTVAMYSETSVPETDGGAGNVGPAHCTRGQVSAFVGDSLTSALSGRRSMSIFVMSTFGWSPFAGGSSEDAHGSSLMSTFVSVRPEGRFSASCIRPKHSHAQL